MTILFDDFLNVEMRVGTILEARAFPQARKPAYQLLIDFGPELGHKKSSAQITHLYTPDTLVGTQVIAVTNFPPRQIANFFSEVLVLGMETAEGITLIRPDHPVPDGTRVS
jgi:tRNA-binding protein